jgi:hypothetical protein
MAARQVLQTAPDQDFAVLLRFIGKGEIHILFREERPQMFVDLLQRGVFECFIAALLGLSFVISYRTDRFLAILMPASFFSIRPFAALYASSALLP